MNLKKAGKLLIDTYNEWQDDKAPTFAAALSFFTVFSLAPLLIIVIAVLAWVFGEKAAEGAVYSQINGLVGSSGALAIQTMIENASKHGNGVLATIIGIITLLIGATTVFAQLQDTLNTMWGVKPKPAGLGI